MERIMSEIKDGGQAFPLPITLSAEGHEHIAYPGMTLRDYFAAKAMLGIIIGNRADESALTIGAAKDAYAVADAMLRARGQS
jgi:hypothetical protein